MVRQVDALHETLCEYYICLELADIAPNGSNVGPGRFALPELYNYYG
jgi:hypothetical protein